MPKLLLQLLFDIKHIFSRVHWTLDSHKDPHTAIDIFSILFLICPVRKSYYMSGRARAFCRVEPKWRCDKKSQRTLHALAHCTRQDTKKRRWRIFRMQYAELVPSQCEQASSFSEIVIALTLFSKFWCARAGYTVSSGAFFNAFSSEYLRLFPFCPNHRQVTIFFNFCKQTIVSVVITSTIFKLK